MDKALYRLRLCCVLTVMLSLMLASSFYLEIKHQERIDEIFKDYYIEIDSIN